VFCPLQALILLINLVEHSKANRKLLLEAKAPSDPESIFIREFMSLSFFFLITVRPEFISTF
jgi:hypothetical protein